MDNTDIINRIKTSFCNLTDFKIRQNALEVITAYATLNNKFASVFITSTNGKLIVTDSGWINRNYYDTPFHGDSEEVIKRVNASYQAAYNIKSTSDNSGTIFYYKSCNNFEEIPNLVFDLANFIVGVVNSYCIQFEDEKEEIEKDTFRKDANDFLKANYPESVKLRRGLDDFEKIKFNAIINRGTKLYLFNYVTGSTRYYFENALRKSIVNFEFSQKSKYRNYIKEKITIFNDLSEGYSLEKSSNIFGLLEEKSTRPPIKWSNKDQILEIV